MAYQSETESKLNLKTKKYLEKEIPKLTSNEHNEIFNSIYNIRNGFYFPNSTGRE